MPLPSERVAVFKNQVLHLVKLSLDRIFAEAKKSEKHREKDKNIRLPRVGGDPVFNCLDSRLRGNDGYFFVTRQVLDQRSD